MSKVDSQELLRGREPEVYAPDEVEVRQATAEPALEVADRLRVMPEFVARLAIRGSMRTARVAEYLGSLSADQLGDSNLAVVRGYQRQSQSSTPRAA